MHIPSELIQKEMYSEAASIWFSLANDGEETAIIIKAPTISIKALIAGCPLNLVFGKRDKHLCIGTQILDMPDSPVFISGIQREQEHHIALIRILKEKKAPIFLFNEMDVCLAWTNCELDEVETSKIVDFIGENKNLYVGPFTEEANNILDVFCNSQDDLNKNPLDLVMDIYILEVILEKWQINSLHFFGHINTQSITIDYENEGELFERLIWVSLESIFPLTLHKSPQVITSGRKREFTDVFSFYSEGTFIIEAKDLSILNAGYDRNQVRRTASVQKQVKKAITQLIGASKALAGGNPIYGENDIKLVFNRKLPPHCIILVTELMQYGDWGDITSMLIEASKKTRCFFHLVDLREFISIIKGSSGKIELIDYNLMKRFELFIKAQSVWIRSQSSLKAF